MDTKSKARSFLINYTDRPYVILGIFIVAGLTLYSFYPNLADTEFDEAGIMRIITIFVIANSLFSLVLPITMKRESLLSRRKDLIFSLFALWLSVFFVLIEIVRGEPYYFRSVFTEFANPFTKFAIIIWLFGIFYLLRITFRILTLDNIHFNKSDLSFKHNKPKNWGIESIDTKFAGDAKNIYFPIYLLAKEDTRPWTILQRFIISGLSFPALSKTKKSGAIYFTFTRPASEIKDALEKEKTTLESQKESYSGVMGNVRIDWNNIVFIDCYTLKNERELWNKDIKKITNLDYADSNNPHELNRKYEQALRKLFKNNCEHIRVVYDAISDFLTFTDFHLATQYLRHNMGFEQRKKIESLYLFRAGTMPKEKEEYFLWFANGVLKMNRKTDNSTSYIEIDFRGPFKEPQQFKLDYDYKIKT